MWFLLVLLQVLAHFTNVSLCDGPSSSSVKIPIVSLQELQTEYTAFHGWIIASLNSLNSNQSFVHGIEQDVQAYDGWISSWLASATSTSTPLSPLSQGPSASQSSAVGSSSVYPAVKATLTTNYISPTTTVKTSTTFGPTYPISTGVSNTESLSANSLAVYYGQSDATAQVTLAQLCQDQNVDIVILAFLTTFFGPGGYPVVNFGAACNGDMSPAAKQKNATGLLSCPQLANEISMCQAAGRKVMLSLGGSVSNTSFSSDSQATAFAQTLWDLFGSGTSDSGLRPFGSVKVDGFDIDNEDHSTAYYSTFIYALRSILNQDTARPYYTSAAPQCPRPDASIPLNGMQAVDFIFLQFYNNGQCDIGQSGFIDSLKAWSDDLRVNETTMGPKLYIGAPACVSCAGAGYLDPNAMQSAIKSARQANIRNLAGVTLWDGAEAVLNVEGGKNYLQVVKSAMTS